MFRRWWQRGSSKRPRKSEEAGFDGQLSEIDSSSTPSASEDEDESCSTSSYVTARASGISSARRKPDQPPPDTIISLLRREFGPRGTLFSVASQEYLNERRSQRLVSKKGQVQIAQSKVDHRRRRYLTDFFNTMLDLKWRYVLLIFTASFFLSWLAFALVWWIILVYRGDFEPGHLPPDQEENEWQPCVLAIYDFASVFLFSVETQHTIGYGTRQTTEKCPEAIFMQSLQSVVGVMIQACMVGTIFAKLARPKNRLETLLFSRKAVVCNRDGAVQLLFRVANLRPSHLIEAHVRAIVISRKVTEEGEVIPFHQTELKVGADMEGEEDSILLIWPTTIVHPIDEESPFYHMSAKDFYRKHYEIIVSLEGIVEPTGMSIQARSSYLGDEILWGYRFANVLHFTDGFYEIDYSAFDAVEKVDTPTASAKHQQEGRQSRTPGADHERRGSPSRSRSAPGEAEATANKNRTYSPHQVRVLAAPGQLQKVSYLSPSAATAAANINSTGLLRSNEDHDSSKAARSAHLN